MIENEGTKNTVALAELASEFWKLLRNYDHVVASAPENLRSGLIAQAKFGARRLSAILNEAGMHVETFDGFVYSTNLPVTAINADDFIDDAETVVEQTLEPAIILGTTPVKTGRVYLRAGNKVGA